MRRSRRRSPTKRKRLGKILRHIEKGVSCMKYRELIAADLEIGTGAVEGAIKNVIGKRCDHGGMRWIKERAEAVLQLRCIEINGDWDAFIDRVHDDNRRDALARYPVSRSSPHDAALRPPSLGRSAPQSSRAPPIRRHSAPLGQLAIFLEAAPHGRRNTAPAQLYSLLACAM